ncbi:stage II sporulation protein P [Oceanobacillus halophilus]|uniref:Stage II sporulation protein P n=1 Tax=Oceanobacillus halophilus TaxID=930130 RepID=A0A495AE48_9BACI|nr:stage II sporulation protein P [Oceanobacillus halophilus]RKQ37840.1 stage II sporulation protein P [Oceanobacillus halophilus]
MSHKYRHIKRSSYTFYKRSGVYLVSIVGLFLLIGALTTIQPAYRISSETITKWTSDIDGSVFLHLIGMENRAVTQGLPEENQLPSVSSTFLQVATSIKPNDPRSLLGNEIPGFTIYDNQVLIAGEGTDYTNLPIESSPPLEEVLRDREAVVETEEDEEVEKDENMPTTGERDVVYIYNSHNRESFLPHLPDVTNPDLAHHDEVNITKVSKRLEKSLEAKGIGTQVEDTDIGNLLKEKGWEYHQSYDAAREVVKEAFSSNLDIQFAFDIHRDAIPREHTTKEIDGTSFAKIMFVVGEDNPNYEKNLKLATELQYLFDEKYPGLSRGVLPQGGAGYNGVYNQDLSENGLLIEFGGVGNNLDELYRTADIVAEVFSEYYWDAESVEAYTEEE